MHQLIRDCQQELNILLHTTSSTSIYYPSLSVFLSDYQILSDSALQNMKSKKKHVIYFAMLCRYNKLKLNNK